MNRFRKNLFIETSPSHSKQIPISSSQTVRGTADKMADGRANQIKIFAARQIIDFSVCVAH